MNHWNAFLLKVFECISYIQDHPGAQYNLGCIFEKGRFVDKSIEKAFSLYKKASQQGFAQAQFSLGFLYEQVYTYFFLIFLLFTIAFIF